MTISKEEMLKQPSLYLNEILADPEMFAELQKRSVEAKKKYGAKPWDAINPNVPKTSDDEAARRYAICIECPEFLRITKQCKLCGCFMKVKTKIENASCPDGKW